MRTYLALFRIRFIHSLQYRIAAYAGCSTQFFWGFMQLLMYWAFYKSGSGVFPMEFEQLSTYIWMQQALLAMFMLWSVDNEIMNMILDGNVAYEIIRPIDLYEMWYVRNMATRVSQVALRCIPVFVVASLLPKPWGLSLPASPQAALWFLISLLLSCGIAVGFCMLIYISVFWTLSSLGVRSILGSITELLSGAIIPIPFMPEPVQKVLYLLPFASLQSAPFLIYTGYMTGAELYRTILVQLFWFVLILFLGRFLIGRALRRVVVQGG